MTDVDLLPPALLKRKAVVYIRQSKLKPQVYRRMSPTSATTPAAITSSTPCSPCSASTRGPRPLRQESHDLPFDGLFFVSQIHGVR